jgi:hypothetical protein
MTTSYVKLDNNSAAQGATSLGMRLGSEKDALDAIDSAADEMREIAERWQNCLTVERHSIAENYAEGRLSLICDLNILVPDARTDRNVGVNHCPLNDGEVFASAIFAADRPNVRNVFFSDQEPVLVFNVESVKSPEGLSYSSLVRLYSVHDEVEDCFGGLLFQSTVDGSYKFIPGRANREVSVRIPGSGCIEFNVAHCKIESTSEIVDCIPNSEKHSVWGNLIHADLKDAISSLRIILDQNAIWVSIRELPRLQIKVVDVLVGPFDL